MKTLFSIFIAAMLFANPVFAKSPNEEVSDLLAELMEMNKTQTFHERGFAASNPSAVDWKKKVEQTSEQFMTDDNVYGAIKSAPNYLSSLGLELIKDPQCQSDICKFYLKTIKDAIKNK